MISLDTIEEEVLVLEIIYKKSTRKSNLIYFLLILLISIIFCIPIVMDFFIINDKRCVSNYAIEYINLKIYFIYDIVVNFLLFITVLIIIYLNLFYQIYILKIDSICKILFLLINLVNLINITITIIGACIFWKYTKKIDCNKVSWDFICVHLILKIILHGIQILIKFLNI